MKSQAEPLIYSNPIVAENAPIILLGPRVRFDGVYAVVLEDEKSEVGKSLCIIARLYEDGTSVEAEFYGKITDCSRWLNRENEHLLPGRWTLDGDELTILESMGIVESARSGKITDQGWTTTSMVTVKDESGWKMEPSARDGRPPVIFRFFPLSFLEGTTGGTRNRRPFFQGIGKYSSKYNYNRAGNLTEINDECEIQAGDLDQDSLKFTWTVSNGSAVGDGSKVVWKRELENGKPKPGEITVEVNDGKGGKVSMTWTSPGQLGGNWALYKY
jgi:hypothetical protein